MNNNFDKFQNIICMNCFKNINVNTEGGEICPHCGVDNSTKQIRSALPYRTVLQDRFMVGRVKVSNAEGFTYKAYDQHNHCLVEIREFCPLSLICRHGVKLYPNAGKDSDLSILYRDFLVLANSLTSVGILSAVIPVVTTFKENNTCYIVYKYYESISLKSYIEIKGGVLDFNTVKAVFTPLINSLSTMHGLGIKHLGITPSTLRICMDGKMRLSEFSSTNLSRVGSPLFPKLTDGTAAIEQYSEGLVGEYTDVYAVAACMFYAVSGRLPAGINQRLKDPSLYISSDILKNIPQNFVMALANALQIDPKDRTKTFKDFRAEILQRGAPNESENPIVEKTKKIIKKRRKPTNKIRGHKSTLIASFLISGFILYHLISPYVENMDLTFTDIFSFFTETIEGIDQQDSIVVPNLVGENYESWEAKVAINPDYNFTIEVTSYQLSNTVDEGYIITQYPSAYDEVDTDTVITVVVSLGPTTRSLPSVVSKTYEEAVELLEADGFVVEVEYQESETVEDGIVLWYGDDKNVGDTLNYGSTVIIVVSGD